MKNIIFISVMLLFTFSLLSGYVTVFDESFNVSSPPAGWSIQGYVGTNHQSTGTAKTNAQLFKNDGGDNYLRLTENQGYNRAWAYYTASKFPVMGEWKITAEVRIGKTHNGDEVISGADGLCFIFADASTCETAGALDMAKVEGGWGEFEGAPRGVVLTSPSYLINSKGYNPGFKGFSLEFDHYNNASELFREYIHWVELEGWDHSGLGANMETDTGFYYNDGWERVQLDANNGVIIFRYNWNGTSYSSNITIDANSPSNPNCYAIYHYDAYLGIGGATGGESAFHEVRNVKLELEEDNTPVELSSFSAVVNAENYVNLNWVTQSETGVQGYYVYRSDTPELSSALAVSPMINATNTALQQSYQFTDTDLYNDGIYYYWLQNVDLGGNTDFHGYVSVNYNATGNDPTPEIPLLTELKTAYPNPFNPTVFIPFNIANTANVNIKVFNERGQMMRNFDLGTKNPGNYRITWDGKDSNGSNCGNGIYHIIMQAGKDSFQSKVVLLK